MLRWFHKNSDLSQKHQSFLVVGVSYPCLDDAFRRLHRSWSADDIRLSPSAPRISISTLFPPPPPKQWTELLMTANAILKKQCRFTMNFRVGNNEEVGVLKVLTFSKFIVDAHLHEGSSVGLPMQIHEWAVTFFPTEKFCCEPDIHNWGLLFMGNIQKQSKRR